MCGSHCVVQRHQQRMHSALHLQVVTGGERKVGCVVSRSDGGVKGREKKTETQHNNNNNNNNKNNKNNNKNNKRSSAIQNFSSNSFVAPHLRNPDQEHGVRVSLPTLEGSLSAFFSRNRASGSYISTDV